MGLLSTRSPPHYFLRRSDSHAPLKIIESFSSVCVCGGEAMSCGGHLLPWDAVLIEVSTCWDTPCFVLFYNFQNGLDVHLEVIFRSATKDIRAIMSCDYLQVAPNRPWEYSQGIYSLNYFQSNKHFWGGIFCGGI